MKIHTNIPDHEYWYDASQRAWYCAAVDDEGNLGPSHNAYQKDDVIQIIKDGLCETPEPNNDDPLPSRIKMRF